MKNKKLLISLALSIPLMSTAIVGSVALMTSCGDKNPPPVAEPDKYYISKDGRFQIKNNEIIRYLWPQEDEKVTDEWRQLKIPEKIELENGAIVEIHDIQHSAFGGGSKDELRKLTSLELPKTLKKIGYRAFNDNNITELVIPDSVVEIGEEAFKGNKIKELTIGSGLTKISKSCFANNNLSYIKSLNNVKIIEEDGFAANSIESLEFLRNSKVEEIQNGAFRDSDERPGNKIPKIIIPKNLKIVGRLSFQISELRVRDELNQPTPNFGNVIDWNGVDYKTLSYINYPGYNHQPKTEEDWVVFMTSPIIPNKSLQLNS